MVNKQLRNLDKSIEARAKEQPEWILVYSVWPADETTKVPKQQDQINVKHLGECDEQEAIERAEKFKYDWEHQPHNLGTGQFSGKILRTLDYMILAKVTRILGDDLLAFRSSFLPLEGN